MGSESGSSDAVPVHEVTLTKAFHLGIYEVTQSQYEQVMGSNPSRFKGADNPVERVNWNDAVEFCKRLSALPGGAFSRSRVSFTHGSGVGVCVPGGNDDGATVLGMTESN